MRSAFWRSRKSLAFLSIAFLFSFSITSAQENPVDIELPPDGVNLDSKMVVIASVEIYNAAVVSQKGNEFDIAFDLFNGKGEQPAVKYAVQVVEQNEDGSFYVKNEQVYDDEVSLGENETIHKEIKYVAPSYAQGKYTLVLVSKTPSGLALGISGLGEFAFAGNGKFVEILDKTCKLSVEGEGADTSYFLSQGVDINAQERLLLTCDVVNLFDRDIQVQPQFETYYRTLFGKKVRDDSVEQQLLAFGAHEQKTVSFLVPRAFEPQAYDVRFGLYDGTGVVSNSIIAHYVLQGASGTIQNFTLDKGLYKRGDVAHMSLAWSKAADGFDDARIKNATDIGMTTADIRITDGDGGADCIEPFSRTLDQSSPMETFDVAFLRDCSSPDASVILKGGDGKVLAKSSFVFSANKNSDAAMQRNESGDVVNESSFVVWISSHRTVLIFAGLPVIVFLLYLLLSRLRVRGGMSRVLFLFGASMVFFGFGHSARAYTVTYTGGEGAYMTYVTNLSKPQYSYALDENIVVNWQMFGYGCANSHYGSISVYDDDDAINPYTTIINYGVSGGDHDAHVSPSYSGQFKKFNVSTENVQHWIRFYYDFFSPMYPATGYSSVMYLNRIPGLTFTATPRWAAIGDTVNLAWNATYTGTNTEPCTASTRAGLLGGATSGVWSGAKPAAGNDATITVDQWGRSIFRLGCTGPGGSVALGRNVTTILSGSGCEIAAGAGTCNASFRWSDASPATSLYNSTTGNAFINPRFDGSGDYPITYGANTIQMKDATPKVYAQTSVAGTCAVGSKWNDSTKKCEYYCTGTIPSNASIYLNDNSGLIANTAYSYAAPDTPAKCEFSCNSGYNWDNVTNKCSCGCDETSNIAKSTCTNAKYPNKCDDPVCPGKKACNVGSWKEVAP